MNELVQHMEVHGLQQGLEHCSYPDCEFSTIWSYNLVSHERRMHCPYAPLWCLVPGCNNFDRESSDFGRHCKGVHAFKPSHLYKAMGMTRMKHPAYEIVPNAFKAGIPPSYECRKASQEQVAEAQKTTALEKQGKLPRNTARIQEQQGIPEADLASAGRSEEKKMIKINQPYLNRTDSHPSASLKPA
ncbi:hypothetical protein PUNSTDRAFT_136835 [Punctularia strigosozonata HHB-11173 SS5]|uniref:uncharacterized protein n=1 Tax=Punctularia strigosozonata (strain HHB-11173) TaxID=741275 RepID=UPI0004418198|nr:uncharacterized protein PUNSTDRAFT_136835 [Punctularia strigosozonata HHB-11173 SS5]EIN06041.1 hypothetical protein PUNSTDRAFT_136835 [Punctularia strigosozonata HHB-11173 SS5]